MGWVFAPQGAKEEGVFQAVWTAHVTVWGNEEYDTFGTL